jgi:hypothetical protein
MKGRMSIVTLAAALLGLVAGCSGLGARYAAVATDISPGSHLSGAWHGTYGTVGGDLYQAEAKIALQIRDDGTFTATMTPNRGTNNLARPSTLSGTVVDRGNLVTLRNTEGPWPWLTLVRAGNVLYGVAADPSSQDNVMLKLERDGTQG